MKKILIVAGGTGGHIFPALAVARELRKQAVEVYWLGVRKGLEEKLVIKEFPLIFISVHGLRGKSLRRKLLAPLKLLFATFQAYRLIRKIKPDVVLGMGGYVTGPAGVAAWLARIPLVIHEQNSIAGFTNRILSKIATRVLQAFPQTFPSAAKVVTTGNPVRTEVVAIPVPNVRFADRKLAQPLRILVLGGSQGAHAINEAMSKAVQDYPNKNELMLWHQTGSKDYATVKSGYESLSIKTKVNEFIDNMADAYRWADVVVCRAGALTVSEIAAVGVASIFVPYPFAVDNHQLHNSHYLEKAGAAVVMVEKLLTPNRLIELFQQFAQDRNRLQSMAENARRFAQPKATENVIAQCEMLSHTS